MGTGSGTPIYDVEAEFARILREYGGLGEGAWAAAKWYAEALVRSRDVLERQLANTYKGYQACNDDLIKCDAEVMRWFKAASPYATPGSLEEGLRGYAGLLQNANDNTERLEVFNAELANALYKLMKEASAIAALAEPQIREAAGNTNFACLIVRIVEAGQVLGEHKLQAASGTAP
jgi:hypothetical protein